MSDCRELIEPPQSFALAIESPTTLNLIIRALYLAVLYMSYIMLGCLIAPAPKKYSALIMAILGATPVILVLGGGYLDGTVTLVSFAAFAGFTAGLIIGILMSYFIFKNKGWNVNKSVMRPS
jgi:hypothetical protein